MKMKYWFISDVHEMFAPSQKQLGTEEAANNINFPFFVFAFSFLFFLFIFNCCQPLVVGPLSLALALAPYFFPPLDFN